MNTNINKAFKKTANGYFGYYCGYYINTRKRHHGGWCCMIGKKGKWWFVEGYFTSRLKTIKDVKRWVKSKTTYSLADFINDAINNNYQKHKTRINGNRNEVKTYRVDKRCEKCEEGLMKCTGSGLTQIDTEWEHECDKCSNVQWYATRYPSIIHENEK